MTTNRFFAKPNNSFNLEKCVPQPTSCHSLCLLVPLTCRNPFHLLRPTYGLVPREGLIDLAMRLDQIGPIAKDVFGTTLLLKVIAGHNERECTTLNHKIPDYTKELEKGLKGLKIGTSNSLRRSRMRG
ncbi:MAG: amidase family protein [Candidatus Micrarchaeaceae archaeon]